MKQLIVFFCVLGLFSTMACKQGFEKIPETEVNSAQKAAAEAFAARVLKSHVDGKFNALPEGEATSEFSKAFDAEKQKASYESIKGLWGDFVSLKYVEAAKPKDGTLLKIYRFRGTFKGAAVEPEIRVVYDGQGKIAGFWLKPWQDKLQ